MADFFTGGNAGRIVSAHAGFVVGREDAVAIASGRVPGAGWLSGLEKRDMPAAVSLCAGFLSFRALESVVAGTGRWAVEAAFASPLPPVHRMPLGADRAGTALGADVAAGRLVWAGRGGVAAEAGRIVSFFKDLGMDVDAPDKNGAAATFRAVFTRDDEVLEGLLAGGADPGARLNGWNLSEAAFSCQNQDGLTVLVAAGAPAPSSLFGPLSGASVGGCSEYGRSLIAAMEHSELSGLPDVIREGAGAASSV